MLSSVIDSRQIRAFCALHETGSFTKAAARLHLTQSAVSHAIRSLEEDLKVQLFERTGRAVSLTLPGEQFLVHASRILREMGECRGRLHELSQWGGGRLRLGLSTSACQHLLPGILQEFRRSHPGARITVHPGDRPQLAEWLAANTIDLAFGLCPHDEGQYEFLPVFEDELHFIMPSGHSWAGGGTVSVSELRRQSFVLYSKSSETYRQIERAFAEVGMTPRVAIELGSFEAILSLVKLDLGVGILAPWVARADLASGQLCSRPTGLSGLIRRWGVSLRRGRRPTLPEETFIRLAQKLCPPLVEPAALKPVSASR